MIDVSLKEFVLTGEFGPVEVGMHRDEIINLLGEPEADQDFGLGFNGLLYGWYEFFYYTDTKILSSMQNDHLMAVFSNHNECIHFQNENIKVDIWFLKAGENFTFSEVKEILTKESIPFSEIDKHDYFEFHFESGVTMDFVSLKDEAKRDQLVLNGIRYFPELR